MTLVQHPPPFPGYKVYHRGSVYLVLPSALVDRMMDPKDPWYWLGDTTPTKSTPPSEGVQSRQPPAGPHPFSGDLAAAFDWPQKGRVDPTQQHVVLRGTEVERVTNRTASERDSDVQRADKNILEKLCEAGPLRTIANPGSKPRTWALAVERLHRAHPHFDAVTDFVVGRVTLSEYSTQPLQIPPIHLWGEPGLGKTHYANDLAQALGAPLRRQSMDNAQSGSLLLGSERYWSNAAHGVIFDQVCMGTHANPIILLDELDKAPTDARYSPTAPLHSLLEPVTSRCVRDAAMDIEFDASLVTYIATSNDPTLVPASLRSRFREFHIEPPMGAQALDVAHVITLRALDRMNIPAFEPPIQALSRKLAHLTAREIHQVVQDAVAKAMQNGRCYLTFADLPADLLDGFSNENVLH